MNKLLGHTWLYYSGAMARYGWLLTGVGVSKSSRMTTDSGA